MKWRAGSVELTGRMYRAGLHEIDSRRITLVRELEQWDGPLNGLATYDGKPHWFDFINDCPECEDLPCEHESAGRRYYYQLKPLSTEQFSAVESAWQSTERYSGPDLSVVEPVGWFMDGQNQSFHAIQVHRKGCDGTDCKCVGTND